MSEDKRQQILALGRMGWTLRRIENATGVRRETAAGYLRADGIEVRPPGSWGRTRPKPAIQVSTDLAAGTTPDCTGNTGETSKPAIEVSTDSETASHASKPSASACEPYRDFIEESLTKGRNAMAIWQDLVDQYGFQPTICQR